MGVFFGGMLLGMVMMGLIVRSLMPAMMFAKYKSSLPFDETVSVLHEQAQQHGWTIPDIRDLQQDYHEARLTAMTRMKILYLCYAQGGYSILQHDVHEPMSVMMPMGVSVYETHNGEVYVAAMNLGTMSMMFGGTVKQVLQTGAANFKKSLTGIL